MSVALGVIAGALAVAIGWITIAVVRRIREPRPTCRRDVTAPNVRLSLKTVAEVHGGYHIIGKCDRPTGHTGPHVVAVQFNDGWRSVGVDTP